MIYLFNTNIVPGEAIVRVTQITPEKAREIVRQTIAGGENPTSAIGHEATAAAMSAILGVHVDVNRIHAKPQPFDKSISLRLNGRLEEGAILDARAMEKIGYTLYLMEFYETDLGIAPTWAINPTDWY